MAKKIIKGTVTFPVAIQADTKWYGTEHNTVELTEDNLDQIIQEMAECDFPMFCEYLLGDMKTDLKLIDDDTDDEEE